MAKKSTTDTCCLTLPLIAEKWQTDRLEKRFEIARQIYNALLNYELKKLRRLEQSKDYKEAYAEITRLLNEPERDDKLLKQAYKKIDGLRREDGFSEYGFKSDIKCFYKHFKDNIGSSVAIHGIAPQVWNAFEKMFYGNGKAVHFKRRGDIRSVRGYSNSKKSGGVEIMFRKTEAGAYIEWKNLYIPVKTDRDNEYETEMLKNRIKYCRIVKCPGKRKSRWYVQLSLEGKPAVKKNKLTGEILHPVGKGAVGIDIGPQTIAYAADKEVVLTELADKVKNIEREKRILQRKMDRSRRSTNPDNFTEDGMIKRGVKLKWNESKHYLKYRRQLAFLQHMQAETRKRQHIELANKMMALGDVFYVEDMAWPSLTHRAKNTEISEKTGRYKKKKRFGKSIGNKAPAMLIGILNQKLLSRGMAGVIKVPTALRASQYNHITNDYQKKELSERWNVMPDGRKLQRDLYSAFLLQHTNTELNGFDLESLNRDYENFVFLHDDTIQKLRSAPKTPASMGIVRKRS